MTETIAELTARLKTEYESANEMFRRGALHALDCGALLNQIKSRLGHGNWEHWLETECPISPRTARRYQYLANHRAKLEASLPNLADLTVSAAEQLIRTRGKYQSCETVNEDSNQQRCLEQGNCRAVGSKRSRTRATASA